jgi:hypothetical protein
MKINKKKDFISELRDSIPKDIFIKAEKKAQREIFLIELRQLRKHFGVTQQKFKNFTQSGISKLESRNDMKLSTLIDYMDDIGLGMEIKIYPKKNKKKEEKEFVLLKT